MTTDFEALKARFQQLQKEQQEGGKKNSFNTDIYPFWTMQMGEEVVIRILPDSDETNPNMFYVEKCEHSLSVAGKERNIACIKKHYGEKCPICELSNKFYKNDDEKTGLYYYFKKRFLMKALVVKDPLPANTETGQKAENKVKVFRLTKNLINKIVLQIANDLDAAPWDFQNGYNFTIMKMAGNGGNADYSIGSSFARKPSVIPAEVVSTIEPTDLKSLLPQNPGLDRVQRLLNSHITGEDDPGDSEEGKGTTPAPIAEQALPESEPTPAPVVQAPVAAAPAVVVAAPIIAQPSVVTPVAPAAVAAAVAAVAAAVAAAPAAAEEPIDDVFAKILARKNAKAAASS